MIEFFVFSLIILVLCVSWYYIGKNAGLNQATAQKIAVEVQNRKETLEKIDSDRLTAIAEYEHSQQHPTHAAE